MNRFPASIQYRGRFAGGPMVALFYLLTWRLHDGDFALFSKSQWV